VAVGDLEFADVGRRGSWPSVISTSPMSVVTNRGYRIGRSATHVRRTAAREHTKGDVLDTSSGDAS